jgi:predicted permease
MAADSKTTPILIIVGVLVFIVLIALVYKAASPNKQLFTPYVPPAEAKPAGIGGLAQLLPLFL